MNVQCDDLVAYRDFLGFVRHVLFQAVSTAELGELVGVNVQDFGGVPGAREMIRQVPARDILSVYRPL